MKRSVLLIGSFCIVALGILGYTLLYAGSSDSAGNADKNCPAATCDKAHAGMAHEGTAGECPYAAAAAKKAGTEACCAAATKGAENGSHDQATCPQYAKMCDGKSKEDCAKFHAGAKNEEEKIEIK